MRPGPLHGAAVGILLGLIALALALAVVASRGSIAQDHTLRAPAVVTASEYRADGATQEPVHGNLAGGADTSGPSRPSGGRGNLP
jgi:hypothetical protein